MLRLIGIPSRFLTGILLFCLLFPLRAQIPEAGAFHTGEGGIAFSAPLQYRSVGPTRGGRVTTVRGVVPQPGVFFMGTTGGGLWKTMDYGAHWENVSDGFFASPSIGAMAIDPTDPLRMYVGTGSDGIRSNVIVGKGIYRSLDGGVSWEYAGLEIAGQIGAVEIHPERPDRIFAAVIGQPFRKSRERGVYRSADGGENWEQVFFLSDSVGAVDLEFAPDNPDVVYAAMWRGERKPWTIISGGAGDGIYRSEDGGESWKKLEQGLPRGPTGKADLAVSPSNPSRVWAQIQAGEGEKGLYRSDDHGDSWTRVELPQDMIPALMHRPFYFTNLHVNPLDADHIWSGSLGLWTSRDAGVSWERIRTTHGDHHDLWIHPQDSLLMIEGNDGGASVSRDGGRNWSTLDNQCTAELYTCDTDDRYPYYIYSGQQDNTTIALPSRDPRQNYLSDDGTGRWSDRDQWEEVGGCETGPAIPKPGDPHLVYSNCKGRFSLYDRRTGSEQLYYVGAQNLYGSHPDDLIYRFQRVTPMEVSPHDPDVLYYGSQYLHRTRNGGRDWERISPDLTANKAAYRMRSGGPIDEDITGEESYAVLYAIQESPVEAGVIWTGSNDGLLSRTLDGGATWEEVTPDMPPDGRVSNIDASPHDAGKAYVAVYRDYLGDDRPYLYRSSDYGQHWTLLSGEGSGIPQDQVVRVVREDPVREGLLFAGTEFGIYISFDDGISWEVFQRNLPVSPVSDLQIKRGDLVLATHGRSFWVMDDISALRELPSAEEEESYLFTPSDNHGGYQRISFRPAPEQSGERFRLKWYRDDHLLHSISDSLSVLEADAWGIRSVGWEQRHYFHDGEKPFRGPRLAPGEYRVELALGKEVFSKSYTLSASPPLLAGGTTEEDLREQEALALEAAELLLELRSYIRDREAALEETGRISRLQKGPGAYDRPGLEDQVAYLYRMVSRSEQKPGSDAYLRLESLKKQWEAFLAD